MKVNLRNQNNRFRVLVCSVLCSTCLLQAGFLEVLTTATENVLVLLTLAKRYFSLWQNVNVLTCFETSRS